MRRARRADRRRRGFGRDAFGDTLGRRRLGRGGASLRRARALAEWPRAARRGRARARRALRVRGAASPRAGAARLARARARRRAPARAPLERGGSDVGSARRRRARRRGDVRRSGLPGLFALRRDGYRAHGVRGRAVDGRDRRRGARAPPRGGGRGGRRRVRRRGEHREGVPEPGKMSRRAVRAAARARRGRRRRGVDAQGPSRG